MTRSIGALVVGGDYQGLGIVRSLGRLGIPTCVLDDEYSIARFSRYATFATQAADLRYERQTVETVLEVGSRFGLSGWVLYPTRDETVAAFSRHRERLAEHFLVPTPPWPAVQACWDKRCTYRLSNELGIPTPRTWYPARLDDLLSIDAELPLVIKPAIKEHFFYATKAKAWQAETQAELIERFERAAALVGPGEVMIQELIPGGGTQQFAYCGFFKDGRALASMVVRRRRQHPPFFGRASTFVETIDLPHLETVSERFLKAIDYYGLVELEYKLDPRDDHYKLLDVNARTWGYHTLGERAGVNFSYLLFTDQVGRVIEPCRARPGVRWVRLATDLPTAAAEIAKRRLDWRAYARSLMGSNVEAVFCRDDVMPGLAELALLPYLFMRRGF